MEIGDCPLFPPYFPLFPSEGAEAGYVVGYHSRHQPASGGRFASAVLRGTACPALIAFDSASVSATATSRSRREEA